MKYIKNMNINYVNNDYLQEHFAEEEEQKKQEVVQEDHQIPSELQGLTPSQLEHNIRSLQLAMEAELEAIKARYTDKIQYYQRALDVVVKKS